MRHKKATGTEPHDWEWTGITRNADQSHRADVWRCRRCGRYINVAPHEVQPPPGNDCLGRQSLELLWPGPQAREPKKG